MRVLQIGGMKAKRKDYLIAVFNAADHNIRWCKQQQWYAFGTSIA